MEVPKKYFLVSVFFPSKKVFQVEVPMFLMLMFFTQKRFSKWRFLCSFFLGGGWLCFPKKDYQVELPQFFFGVVALNKTT